ncbi:Meckel syndrome type 1 protein homolog [Argonauta hians]
MTELHDDCDVATAYYRTKDQLRNFKLRICLKRVTSHAFFNQDDDDIGIDVSHDQYAAGRDVEVKVFSWQQKCFSQREIDYFSVKENCTDILSEKYNDEVCKLTESDAPRRRLFTYVNNDKFLPPESITPCTTSRKEKKTALAEQMMAQWDRNKVTRRNIRDSSYLTMNERSIVDVSPSKESRRHKKMYTDTTMRMFIMADLSPKNINSRPEDERVLCAIEADSNGVISLRPDLSKGRKPYTIGSSGLGRDVFEYSIEHVSNDISREYHEQEQKMYKELYHRHNNLLATVVGKEFETVDRNVLRLMVFGEIVSAKNFEYDNLYLHFFVELPKGWAVPSEQELSWVTQTCQTKAEGQDNVAYYSFPFNMELFYQTDQAGSDEEKLPSLPVIYIEVLSLDSWRRFRTEGYTHYVLPSQTGHHKETLCCWRPTGVSPLSELRRFFIGGSPELEDPTFTCVPSTFEGKCLSKFGFRTETTGSVDIRLNLMLHSKALSDKKRGTEASSSNILQTLGLNNLQASVMQVLVSLRNAQRRMRLAKEKAMLVTEYEAVGTET